VALVYLGLFEDSLERLCLGGIAWNENDICVHRVTGLSRLRHLRGPAASWFLRSSVDQVLQSLREHLECQPGAQRSLQGWAAPFRGVHLLSVPAIGSPQAALHAQLALHASLYQPPKPAQVPG
jgi:hypothetical protein